MKFKKQCIACGTMEKLVSVVLINYLTFLGKDIKMVVPWNLYLRNIMKEEKALFYRYTLCNGGDKLGRNVQQYGGSLMKIM